MLFFFIRIECETVIRSVSVFRRSSYKNLRFHNRKQTNPAVTSLLNSQWRRRWLTTARSRKLSKFHQSATSGCFFRVYSQCILFSSSCFFYIWFDFLGSNTNCAPRTKNCGGFSVIDVVMSLPQFRRCDVTAVHRRRSVVTSQRLKGLGDISRDHTLHFLYLLFRFCFFQHFLFFIFGKFLCFFYFLKQVWVIERFLNFVRVS